MWSRARFLLHVVLAFGCGLAALAAGCGYQVGSTQAPTVLPEGRRTIAISKVENPTVEEWIEPLLRSKLRDEIAGRGVGVFTDLSKADTHLNVRIVRFVIGAAIKDKRDMTRKYAVDLYIEGKLVDGKDHTPIWESGVIHMNEMFDGNLDRAMAEDWAITLAVRELVDRMGQAF